MDVHADSLSISEASTVVDSPILKPLSLQPTKERLEPQEVVIAKEDETKSTPGPTALASASTPRKLALLSIFTLASFLDCFNTAALFPVVPAIASQLQIKDSESTWITAGYQLTFAAFLLISGRISDIKTPKPVFISGSLILGVTHLIGGFTRKKIAFLVLRALAGIGGALVIPSSLSLIIQLFPDPSHKARAIALFSSGSAMGNILGTLIGAILVQRAGWEWILWVVAVIGISIALISLLFMPSTERNRSQTAGFDVFGVSLFTVAVILFSVAVTSGPTQGWATPHVLAPLLISISLATVFFFWESRIPFEDAVLPPRMWRYQNFGIIVILALVPVFWWVTSFISLTSWWETVYGWSAVKTAVHTLPMGITAWLISYVAACLPSYFSHRAILISGLLLTIPATALLSFANAPETYWRFAFPAFVVGSIGMMIVLVNGSIAIFAYTPPSSAGTVGAVYNSALKLGSAIGLAAVQSITISIDQRNSGSLKIPVVEWSQHVDQITKPMWELAFRGRAASYWFILAILGLQLVAVIVFFKKDVPDYQHEQNTRPKQDVEAGITGVEEKD